MHNADYYTERICVSLKSALAIKNVLLIIQIFITFCILLNVYMHPKSKVWTHVAILLLQSLLLSTVWLKSTLTVSFIW